MHIWLTWLLRILFFMSISYSCPLYLLNPTVPPPTRVRIEAYNVNTILSWDYPTVPQAPVFTAQVKTYGWVPLWSSPVCLIQVLAPSVTLPFCPSSFLPVWHSFLNCLWTSRKPRMPISSFQNTSCLLVPPVKVDAEGCHWLPGF